MMNAEIVDDPVETTIMKRLEQVTPGNILPEAWLRSMGLSQYRLALEIGVSPAIASSYSIHQTHGFRDRGLVVSFRWTAPNSAPAAAQR